MNLGSLLNISASKYPERTAIISAEGRWTFKAFDERTNRLAGAFLNAGLAKGDRIALLFYNSSYFVEAYFAAVKIGLVATPVNFRFTGPEIVYVLNDAQPLMLLYGPEFDKTLLAVRDQLVSVRHFVSPKTSASLPQCAIPVRDAPAGRCLYSWMPTTSSIRIPSMPLIKAFRPARSLPGHPA